MCSKENAVKLETELSILRNTSHPNVVQYYKYEQYYSKEVGLLFIDIVMERCKGTIKDFLIDNTKFPGFEVKAIMYNMARGLEYLHSNGIIHIDIKPENVLLSTKDGQAKLADFGISKELENDQSSVTNTSSCTMLWAAPELIDPKCKSERIRPSVDIFSLGLVYYHLATKSHLFGNKNLNAYTGSRQYDHKILQGGCNLHDLIHSMSEDDSDHRINARNILDHPYFWDGNETMDFFRQRKDIIGDVSNDFGEWIIHIFSKQHTYENWGDILPQAVNEFYFTKNPYKKSYKKTKRVYKSGIKELIFCIRNTFEHITEMPPSVHVYMGSTKSDVDKYLNFWSDRFPELVIWLYKYFPKRVDLGDVHLEFETEPGLPLGLIHDHLRLSQYEADLHIALRTLATYFIDSEGRILKISNSSGFRGLKMIAKLYPGLQITEYIEPGTGNPLLPHYIDPGRTGIQDLNTLYYKNIVRNYTTTVKAVFDSDHPAQPRKPTS